MPLSEHIKEDIERATSLLDGFTDCLSALVDYGSSESAAVFLAFAHEAITRDLKSVLEEVSRETVETPLRAVS